MSSFIVSLIRIQPRQSLVLFVAILAILSCTNEEPTVKPPAEQYPSSEATNATTVFLTGSVVTTKIKSGRIVSFTEQDSSWAFELFVDFYDSSGTHTSTLRSDSALIRERRRLLDVFGNVQVNTDKGTTLDSEHLAWSDSSRTISTDSLVVITQGEDVMSGYGFRSDPELTRIVFRRQVSGLLSDPQALEEEDREPVLPDSVDTAIDSLQAPSEKDSMEQSDG
jgi:LPS export ABC transporter protein LptC